LNWSIDVAEGTNQSARPIRWGVVGLGRLVEQWIVPAMVASPGSELVACLGSSPAKTRDFAARHGVPGVFDDPESLAADPSVDAVYVATPNALHGAAVFAAARHRKPVLCEKPLSIDLAEATAMVAACREPGVVLRVAHQIRLEPVIQRLRDVVRSGEIGELRAISLERNGPMGGARAPWRLDVSQGGALFDMAVHLLDLVQWVSGLPYAEVSALSHPDRRAGLPDETITVLAMLGDSCQAVVRATREMPSVRNDFVVQGTRGMAATSALRWTDRHVLTITTPEGTREEAFMAAPSAYRLEIEAFERELAGQRTDLPDGESGIALVEVVNAITRSIDERRTVPIASRAR
jgi:predicted dehydrogenase